jgi:hypothetical protein
MCTSHISNWITATPFPLYVYSSSLFRREDHQNGADYLVLNAQFSKQMDGRWCQKTPPRKKQELIRSNVQYFKCLDEVYYFEKLGPAQTA